MWGNRPNNSEAAHHFLNFILFFIMGSKRQEFRGDRRGRGKNGKTVIFTSGYTVWFLSFGVNHFVVKIVCAEEGEGEVARS